MSDLSEDSQKRKLVALDAVVQRTASHAYTGSVAGWLMSKETMINIKINWLAKPKVKLNRRRASAIDKLQGVWLRWREVRDGTAF